MHAATHCALVTSLPLLADLAVVDESGKFCHHVRVNQTILAADFHDQDVIERLAPSLVEPGAQSSPGALQLAQTFLLRCSRWACQCHHSPLDAALRSNSAQNSPPNLPPSATVADLAQFRRAPADRERLARARNESLRIALDSHRPALQSQRARLVPVPRCQVASESGLRIVAPAPALNL